MIDYKVDDKQLSAEQFIELGSKIWQGNYDVEKVTNALSKTVNITAWDGNKLVGCIRLLTDGYFFGTICEILVSLQYRRQGIGSNLLQLAKENTPTTLYFGARAETEEFYKKNGCVKGMQSYVIRKNR